MKKYLVIALLLLSFAVHAETLPEPSIDTEPRGCNNTTTPCLGWIFAYQKWMDDKGQIHRYSQVYVDKKEASNVGDAYKIAMKRALGQ